MLYCGCYYFIPLFLTKIETDLFSSSLIQASPPYYAQQSNNLCQNNHVKSLFRNESYRDFKNFKMNYFLEHFDSVCSSSSSFSFSFNFLLHLYRYFLYFPWVNSSGISFQAFVNTGQLLL